MKKILIAAVLAVAGTTAASAADMAARPYTKAPAPVYAAQVYNWTGIYVGAHIGGAFSGNNNGIGVAGFPTGSNNGSFLGGGQIGADYQFSSWVIGAEANISGRNRNNRNVFNAAGAGFTSQSGSYLGSVTGRVGYAWDNVLLYGKGGYAYRDNSNFVGFTAPGAVTPILVNRNTDGYTLGGGLEYMFAPSWSTKLEYQYYNFGNTNIVIPAVPALAAPGATFRSDLHTVKLGVNYRFGGLGSGY